MTPSPHADTHIDTHTHIDTETDRQKGRQAGRQTAHCPMSPKAKLGRNSRELGT